MIMQFNEDIKHCEWEFGVSQALSGLVLILKPLPVISIMTLMNTGMWSTQYIVRKDRSGNKGPLPCWTRSKKQKGDKRVDSVEILSQSLHAVDRIHNHIQNLAEFQQKFDFFSRIINHWLVELVTNCKKCHTQLQRCCISTYFISFHFMCNNVKGQRKFAEMKVSAGW